MVDFVGIDTETYLIERGLLAPPMVCYQWADKEWGGLVIHHSEAEPLIREHLSSNRILVGHNIAYDTTVICASYLNLRPLIWSKYERGEIVDTQVAEYLIEIASGAYAVNLKRKGYYSLASTSARYGLEKDGDDPWRLRYGELYDIPVEQWPKEAIEYAAHDAEVVLEIIKIQYANHGRYLGDLEKQSRTAFCLQLMSAWGVHTDPIKTEKLREDVTQLILSVQTQLIEARLVEPAKKEGYKKNMRDAQRLMMDECMKIGLEPKWTKKGLELEPKERAFKYVSLDEEACEMSGNELLKNYSLYARQNTLRTRVESLAKGYVYPLQARFNVLKETGRTSSSKGDLEGVQMQNPSQKLGDRECFVPRDGMCFISADINKAELHTWGQVCLDLFGFSDMADTLNAGQDPYLKFVASAYNLSYEETSRRYLEEDEEICYFRQKIGKPIVLGLPGGMGAKRLRDQMRSYGTDITEDQAKEYIGIWRRTYSEATLYFRHINSLLSGTEKTRVKQLRVDRYRGRVGYCDTANGFFQGLASDAIKEALWYVSRACYLIDTSPAYGWRPWNIVHDEILSEGPIDTAHEAAIEKKRLIEYGFNKFVPDVPTTTDPIATMIWSKGAKAVYNERGEMIPWTP